MILNQLNYDFFTHLARNLAEARVLAASWTKPSERPQLALAGRGVCKPRGRRCLPGTAWVGSLLW